MDMDDKKNFCPKLDVDGVISSGKQFDLDITLPEDNRDVIYGVVKNCFKEPVTDAVVKLVEVVYDDDKKERRPVGHTFTDKEGEFVFGPLCPGKVYSIQIWVNDTKKFKLCAKCHHEGKCLKGDKCDKCDSFLDKKHFECKCKCDKKHDKEWEKDYDKEYDKDYDKNYDKECEKEHNNGHDKDYEKGHDKEYDKDYEKDYNKDYKEDNKDKDNKKHLFY